MEENIKDLTILVIAKNEASRIGRCLKSASFAGRIIVLDNDSSDDTKIIAQHFGADIIVSKTNDFSEMRNILLKSANTKWIMYLDADEEIPQELMKEIISIIQKPNDSNSVFFISRKTFYFGNYLWPKSDQVERLFLKKAISDWYGKVHESPKYVGIVGKLANPLNHYTHRNLTEMVDKTNKWSDIEAELRHTSHHPHIVWWRIFRVMITGFWDSFVDKQGYKLGTVGLIESIFQSFSIFITYAKLWEMQLK